MEQNIKQTGYPDVQSFTKAYHKSKEPVREYNKELREWKNQTAQKKEQTSEPPTKASVLKKLHSYQQEGRKQPKRTEEKEPRFVGVWGQRHLRYLKEYRRNVYLDLLMSGRLNNYLADIEEQAQERFERLIEQMKQAQGITEQLKGEDAWEWVGRMNNIRACAREIVDKEIIYA